MDKNIKKLFLISGAALSLLSINSIVPVHHIHHSVLASSQNDTDMESKGYKQGMKSFKKMQTANGYLTAFIKHESKLENSAYRRGFIEAFNNYSHNSNKLKSVSSLTRLAVIHIFNRYLHGSDAFRAGIRESSDSGSGIIPKSYRHNTSYGKGYIIGDELSYDLVNHYPYRPVLRNLIIHYSNYRDSKGKLSISNFIGKSEYKAYVLCSKINRYIYEHALDRNQSLDYQNKILSKHHFNTKHGRQLIYDVQINDLSQGKYAKALINKYPLAKRIYFPKSTVNDYKQLNGVELGIKKNAVTRDTMVAYKSYVSSLYHKSSKSNLKHFKNDYRIKAIAINPHNYDTGCSTIYQISNKHKAHSTILYVMPFGEQGFVPKI